MARSSTKSYEIDMLNGAIFPKLLRFAVPLTLSTMLQLLFNAADVVVVGRYAGDNSLAAVGSNTALINLLTNLFLGLSIGANILAARHYGAHEDEELSKTVHTSILLSIYSGLLLTVVGILGARTILEWMQCPDNVLGLATTYLRIYFAGQTATMLYNFGAALLRAGGDTQRPLYFLFAAGIVNVVLNLVFVIKFQMDVAGVALATVISQCISAALVIRCLMKETGPLRLDLRQLKIYPMKLKQIMQVGIPAGIQGILFSLANVTVQSSINSFDDTTLEPPAPPPAALRTLSTPMSTPSIRPTQPLPARTSAPGIIAAFCGFGTSPWLPAPSARSFWASSPFCSGISFWVSTPPVRL